MKKVIMWQKFKKKVNYYRKSLFSRKCEKCVKNMSKTNFNKLIKILKKNIKNVEL